jgi:hypothetical protein
MAVQAEIMAELADGFASHLEHAAQRGDAPRRRKVALWERAVAKIGRRNAERLRSDEEPLDLEHLPSAPTDP